MKKCIAFILAVFIMLVMFGYRNNVDDVGTTKIYLPFSLDQIDYIEMFHYTDDTASAEKKIITKPENIPYLYGAFEHLSVETLLKPPKDEAAEVIAFRFYLSNSTEETFEIIYYGYGLKNGVLKMPPNEIYFSTSADIDIGRYWIELDEGLEAMPANENELPK